MQSYKESLILLVSATMRNKYVYFFSTINSLRSLSLLLILLHLAACGRSAGFQNSGDNQIWNSYTPPTIPLPKELRIPNPSTNAESTGPDRSATTNTPLPAKDISEINTDSVSPTNDNPETLLKELDNYKHIWVNVFPNFSDIKVTHKNYPPAKNLNFFKIESEDGLLEIRYLETAKLLSYGRIVSLDLTKNEIKIDSEIYPFQDILVLYKDKQENNFLKACWNNNFCHEYHGAFKVSKKFLKNKKSYIHAVNIVTLDQYVKGVVKNEIGSNIENFSAIEAQAIAARTYALFSKVNTRKNKFFAENGFEVYSTELSQLYLGRKSESEITNKAVINTSQKVILYGDDIIRAEYHSSAGGKTTADPKVPYLKSVLDPGTANKKRLGHGRGMSQHGAIYFSKKLNWNTERILDYYYFGIHIRTLTGI